MTSGDAKRRPTAYEPSAHGRSVKPTDKEALRGAVSGENHSTVKTHWPTSRAETMNEASGEIGSADRSQDLQFGNNRRQRTETGAAHRHFVMTKAEIRRRVRLVEDLTAKWSYECKYHDWDQFRLVQKGCAQVKITQAQYWTYRRP